MYYFIVNATSRTGKAQQIWKDVKAELDSKGIEYKFFMTGSRGHAKKLATKICKEDGEIKLVVVGGDGTANEVINGIQDFDRVKFGYVPTGSGNDLG